MYVASTNDEGGGRLVEMQKTVLISCVSEKGTRGRSKNTPTFCGRQIWMFPKGGQVRERVKTVSDSDPGR